MTLEKPNERPGKKNELREN